MKKNKLRNEFLDQLRKIPIVLVACEKTGLSRNSVYRWRNEDEAFSKEMEEALKEGEELVNDMGESQLLTLIKEKNWSAISFWLRHRNPKFKERIEITTKASIDVLSPEQEALVREALQLATGNKLSITNINEQNHEPKKTDSTGTGGDNVKGPESTNSDN
jgi:hypothetical protein